MKNIFKNKKMLFSLGILVPTATFSIVALGMDLKQNSKYNNLFSKKNSQSLNKTFASMNLQSQKSLLISEYFGNDKTKQKEVFKKKFKEYWTSNYNLIKQSLSGDKHNINDIFSWIDFNDIKIIQTIRDDSFYKLLTFQLGIKNSNSKINVNFCFYQSMATNPTSNKKQELLDKIKKQFASKKGIYKLSSFKNIPLPQVKGLRELQNKVKNGSSSSQTGSISAKIRQKLNNLADSFNAKKAKDIAKEDFTEHKNNKYKDYQRVYFKNNIGVFLLRVKNSSGKFTSGKFAIYDYASKSELTAPTIIDDFDGGESKHFKILNNNLFYSSEKGDTEYLNYIDLSTKNTIQNPHLEIYQDYNLEIEPHYSGSDEVLIIQHNKHRGGDQRQAFDVVNKKVIFDFNKNRHGSDNLLFRMSQDKKTFYFNEKNTDYNNINTYTKNPSNDSWDKTLIEKNGWTLKGTAHDYNANKLGERVWRVRSSRFFKEIIIDGETVKNVNLSLLQNTSMINSPYSLFIIYEKNGQLINKNIIMPKNSTAGHSYLELDKAVVNYGSGFFYKNKKFIYISTAYDKKNKLYNKLNFQEAKRKLVNKITDSFIDYQIKLQKLLYGKDFILYEDVLSKFKNILTYIKIKIDKEKIKEMITDSIDNFDFTSNPISILGHKSYRIALDLNKLKNFMSFIYRDIAGNESDPIELEFDNKNANGISQNKYDLILKIK